MAFSLDPKALVFERKRASQGSGSATDPAVKLKHHWNRPRRALLTRHAGEPPDSYGMERQ